MPSPATAAASAGDAPLRSADSTPSARTGVEPMFTSATPGVSPPTAATPTIAQSCARRLNFSNAQPAPLVLGTRTSVMISSGASAVSRKPWKKSSAAITRSPPLPRTTMLPRRASTHRGQVGRRVAVRERAAEGAAVTDLRIADLAAAARQDRHVLAHQRVVLDVVVAGEAADRDRVAGVAHVGEVGEPTDVDEHRRRRQPQLHQRQQRVAAGEELGVVAVLGEQRDRVVDGVGAGVVERGGDHRPPAISAEPASTAATMLW